MIQKGVSYLTKELSPVFKLGDIVIINLDDYHYKTIGNLNDNHYDVKSGDIGIVEYYLNFNPDEMGEMGNKSKIYTPTTYPYWVRIFRTNETHLYSENELKVYTDNQVEIGVGYLYDLERNITI